MIFRIFGINQNVINEDHYEFVKFLHEDRVHEIHEVCRCYLHNLTGPENGPRATWAEGDNRDGLRIGFYASVLRAGMAVCLVRIV
jgi:hypothetical protein